MASTRRVTLLLNQNVESLGIVGDVVQVRPGFARNYLVPMGIGEAPTPTRIEALQEDRNRALAELSEVRSAREELIQRLEGFTATMIRACNDQGVLYGSVTQRDISDALAHEGFEVGPRAVRLHQAIRHLGENLVTIQFDADLRVDIEVIIEPDRPLEERDEMEFDDEGNLIIKEPKAKRTPKAAEEDVPAEDQAQTETEPSDEPAQEAATTD